jgi:hypothetical protein
VEPAIALGGRGWTRAAPRGVLVGGRGTDGPRAEPRAPGVHSRPAGRSTAAPTARPSAWAIAW